MFYYISKEVLKEMKDIAYNYTEEMCCFLSEKNSNIYIDHNSCQLGKRVAYEISGKEKFRGSCNFKVISDINDFPDFFFHTHPVDSKPYPSYEDVRSVFKLMKVKAELISTRDGLWIMSTNNTIKFSMSNKYIDYKGKFDNKKFDNKFSKGFHHFLKQFYDTFKIDRTKTLKHKDIENTINNFANKYKFSIQFYNWDEILDIGVQFLVD